MIERVQPETVGLSSARLERATGWLSEQIDTGRLAGASMLVGRHGGLTES